MLLFGVISQTKAQDLKQSTKPRPADFEYLSAPDSLGIRHQLKMPNIATNKKTLAVELKLPYPIIFIYGLNSDATTWNSTTDFMDSNYFLTYGGRFDFNLNFDGVFTYSNKKIYPEDNPDIAQYTTVLKKGDYYYVNFAVGSDGSYNPSRTSSTNVLSNQSAIAKQGIALKQVIMQVMQLTGRDKVVLMGHSMGGLAAREYLQNKDNWQIDGKHHVAKLTTTGTPHSGSDAIGGEVIGVDYSSEAIRDLKNTYFNYSNNGIFLFGGKELDDGGNYYNVDVNCDGNGITEDLVIGLNQKSISTDLDYSCIIGTGMGTGDIAVNTTSANINNVYSNLTKNVFSAFTLHNFLTARNYENMQGLDEPNEYNLAYGIQFDKIYSGFTTVQPEGGYPYDYDDYTFNVTSAGQVNVNISDISLPNLMARIVDINNNRSVDVNNIGTSLKFNITLPVGKYYLEIFGNPTTTSYLKPYTFELTTGALSTDDFDLSTVLNIYPNPTTSKVFFDNSIHNFENVSVVNSLGQVVSKNTFSTFLSNQEIDLSSLPSGIYFIKLNNNQITKTVKVIKE